MPIACPSSDHHGSGAVNVNEHHSLPPSRPRARPGEVHKSVEEGGGHPASPFYGQQFCPAENKTSFAARERERERERPWQKPEMAARMRQEARSVLSTASSAAARSPNSAKSLRPKLQVIKGMPGRQARDNIESRAGEGFCF